MANRRSGSEADALSLATATVIEGESMARQEGKEDADINVLVQRFGVGAVMPAPAQTPEYGDFTGVDDFQSALNALNDAEERFSTLPAQLRKRFENDPGQLLEFLEDDANRGEAIELGIIPRPAAPPAPQEVVVVEAPGSKDPELPLDS